MVIFKENYHFLRFRRGPTFSRSGDGVHFFSREGSNCLFPIEPNINCDFPGGSGNPCPTHPTPSGSAFDFFPLFPHCCGMSTFPCCSAPLPPPPPTTIPRSAHTFTIYVHLPFSLELDWKRIRLFAYQSCWLSS